MDKLIYKEASGDLTCSSRDFDKIFAALYDYESTDRTPEQIDAMKIKILNMSSLVIELQGIIDQAQKTIEAQQATITKLKDSLRDLAHCPSCKHHKKPDDQAPCDRCTYDSNWEWAEEKEM